MIQFFVSSDKFAIFSAVTIVRRLGLQPKSWHSRPACRALQFQGPLGKWRVPDTPPTDMEQFCSAFKLHNTGQETLAALAKWGLAEA